MNWEVRRDVKPLVAALALVVTASAAPALADPLQYVIEGEINQVGLSDDYFLDGATIRWVMDADSSASPAAVVYFPSGGQTLYSYGTSGSSIFIQSRPAGAPDLAVSSNLPKINVWAGPADGYSYDNLALTPVQLGGDLSGLSMTSFVLYLAPGFYPELDPVPLPTTIPWSDVRLIVSGKIDRPETSEVDYVVGPWKITVTPVPAPAGVWLLGTALALIGIRRTL